jgi:hypothetical protein
MYRMSLPQVAQRLFQEDCVLLLGRKLGLRLCTAQASSLYRNAKEVVFMSSGHQHWANFLKAAQHRKITTLTTTD